MNKERSYIVIATIILLGGFLWYHENSNLPSDGKKQSVTIRIGMPFTPGFMPVLFAKEKGYMNDEGLDLVLFDTQPTYGQMPKIFSVGEYDIVALSNSVFVSNPDINKHGKVALIGYYSLDGSAFVAKKGITSLAMARGKTIAVLENGYFNAYWALRPYGIPFKDVTVVGERWDKLLGDMKEGKYDYAFLTSPDIDRYVAWGGKVVASAKDEVGSVTTVYVFNDKFLRDHRDAAVSFVHGYFRALNYIEAHPEEFRDFLMAKIKMTRKEADSYIKSGSQILSARENLEALRPGYGIKNFEGNVRYIQEYLTVTGRGGPVDMSDRIDAHIVNEAMLRP